MWRLKPPCLDKQLSSVSPHWPEHRQVSEEAHEVQSRLKHAVVSCSESAKKFIFGIQGLELSNLSLVWSMRVGCP